MPRITQIAQQKRRPNRRSIYLDGTFAFGCHVNVVARFRLREGMELTPEQIRQIEQGELRQECMDAAMRFLQRRLHSRAELQRKLLKDHAPPLVENVLEDLARLGYVDDARFAKARALASAEHRHHGPRRAMLELMTSGVAADLARRTIAEVYQEHDSQSAAEALARKHAPRLRRLDQATARRRLAGLLQRRGFDYETVRPIIDQVLGDSE